MSTMEWNIEGVETEGVITDTSEITSIDICPSCGYNITEPPGPDCTMLVMHGIPKACPITKDIIPE